MSRVVMKSGELRRYTAAERANHWVTAITFILLMLSGLAFFHPTFFFLTGLFGSGSWARILHPFLGLVMTASFFLFALRLWQFNKFTPEDREWMKHFKDIVNNTEDHNALPTIGRYNAGQKRVFWVMVWGIVLLLVSGLVMWRPYFAGMFPADIVRVALVVHMLAAFAVILAAIVHVYAAIWVKGTMRAMTRGTVSHGWARAHHPGWYREITGNKR